MAYIKRIITSGGGGGGYNTIQDEGVSLAQENTLNFVGSSVTAVDDAVNSRTNVTFNAKLNQISSSTLSKGMLYTSNGAAITVLPVGPNDAYLVSDSTQTNGIRWESAYNTIEEETAALPQRAVLNFEGSAVTAVDDAGNNRTNVVVDQNVNDIADLVLNKGDILVSNGTNIVDLAVGTNGQALIANSATATGLAWTNLINAQNVIYVSKNGNDATGNGSFYNPYLTIAAANAAVTGASTSNRFLIYIFSGTYAESSNLKLKAWTYYCGQGLSTRITSPNNLWEIDLTDTNWNSSARAAIRDVVLSGSTGISFDLTSFASSSAVIDIVDSTVNGGLALAGRSSGADSIQVYNSYWLSAISISNFQGFLKNSFGNSTFAYSASTANVTLDMQSFAFGGNASVSSSGGFAATLNVGSSRMDGTLTLNGAATIVNIDAVSLPTLSTSVTVNAGTLNKKTEGYAVRYDPAVPGNWSPVPDDVSEALDQLAARPTGGGLTWTVVTGSTTLAADNGYFSNNVNVVFSLPATAAVGDTYRISNIGTGFTVSQGAGQSIRLGNVVSTTGAGGSVVSTTIGDSIEIVCSVANTGFQIVSSIGELTLN